MPFQKRSKSRQDIIDVAKEMPPLFHKLPGEDFNLIKSRVLWWLVKQPEVLKYIWDIVKQSGAIVYDASSGKWSGINFQVENDEYND